MIDVLLGGGNNIWGYIFGGQVIKNGNNLITGAGKWTKMSHSDRDTLIQYTCRVAVSLVLSGEAASIDDVFADVIPTVGQEYINWKQHSNNAGYMGWINTAKTEVSTAQSIINSSNNSTEALARMNKANFNYVSKTQVSSIVNGNYYDPATDTETIAETNQLVNSAGFAMPNLIGFIKENKLVAAGLAAVSIIGLFFIVNRPSKQQHSIAAPQQVELKGLK